MSFNGFIVFYLSNDTKREEVAQYSTEAEVQCVVGKDEPFPDAETLAEDAFNVFGDIVEKVTDLDGKILYENFKAYEENKRDSEDFF